MQDGLLRKQMLLRRFAEKSRPALIAGCQEQWIQSAVGCGADSFPDACRCSYSIGGIVADATGR